MINPVRKLIRGIRPRVRRTWNNFVASHRVFSNGIKRTIFILIAVLFFSGCAVMTGPAVSREEVYQATEELKIKALAFQIKQLQRLNKVTHRVVSSVRQEDVKHPPQPFLGIVCASADKYLRKLYALGTGRGVVVVVVKDSGPADKAGIKVGDVVVSVDNLAIRGIQHYNRVVSRFKIDDSVKIEISREGRPVSLTVKIGRVPVDIPVLLVDRQDVNAATDGSFIYVTTGLLYFIESDDELAAVIAHELAHAVRNHVVKMQGTQLAGMLAALVLGTIAESGSPGSGDIVMRGVGHLSSVFGAGYSRDLEREADYFSVKFVYQAGFNPELCATLFERFAIELPASMVQNYLSTHPSSPERLLRIRKTIAQLERGDYSFNESK